MMILYFIQVADTLSSSPPPQTALEMGFQIIIGFVGGTAGTTLISKAFDVQKVKQLTKMLYELELAQKDINELKEDLAEEREENDLLLRKLEEYAERQTTGITNKLSDLEEQCRALRESNQLKERQLEKAKKLLRANNINVNKER